MQFASTHSWTVLPWSCLAQATISVLGNDICLKPIGFSSLQGKNYVLLYAVGSLSYVTIKQHITETQLKCGMQHREKKRETVRERLRERGWGNVNFGESPSCRCVFHWFESSSLANSLSSFMSQQPHKVFGINFYCSSKCQRNWAWITFCYFIPHICSKIWKLNKTIKHTFMLYVEKRIKQINKNV